MIPFGRFKTILKLSLPIIGGMVSQNILNLVDTAMVGRLGNASLAAVGLASFLVFFSQAFLIGLSSGVQAMVARRKGAGESASLTEPLHAGLLCAFIGGLVITVILYHFASDLMGLLNDDDSVAQIGAGYYETRILAAIFVGMNFCFRGYWNAVNLSMLYMRTLIVMHILNIALNYMFIFGHFGAPELGATGAALGTAIATVSGTLMYFVLGMRHARKSGFLTSFPQTALIRRLLSLSLPTGIQQLFFAGGLTTLFYIVGKVGTVELAAANVLINVMLVGILPGLGLGLAATSLVGQAIGRKDMADAKAWGFDVLKCGVVILAILGLPMWMFPEAIIGVFIQDPNTIAVAIWPMRISGLGLCIDAMGLILQHSLFGAGDTRRTAQVAVGLQWLFFLPLAYLFGPVLGYGLIGIWGLQALYRFAQAVVFFSMWNRERWTQITI